MSTTSAYGWNIPDNTDLVKDGALAIRTLGNAIDTSMNTALGTRKAGMVLLNTTSFSGVASQSMPASSFTSTYTNYMAIINVSADSNRSLSMQFRAGSTNKATGYYANGVQMIYSSTTVTGQATNNQSSFYLGEIISSGLENGLTLYFYNPADSGERSLYSAHGYTGDYFVSRGGMQIDSEAFDSFTIFPSAGTISGKVSIYGVNK
jgi:hypothetical protein